MIDEDVTISRATVADAATVVALIDALLAELRGGASGSDYPGRRGAVRDAARGVPLHRLPGAGRWRRHRVITLTETATVYARGTIGVIQELYVAPALRSRGVGHRLIAAAQAEGRTWGWRGIQGRCPRPDPLRPLASPSTSAKGFASSAPAWGGRLSDGGDGDGFNVQSSTFKVGDAAP